MQEKKRLKIGIFMDSFYPAIDGVVIAIDNLATMLSKNNDVTVVVPKTSSYKEDYKKPYKIIRITSISVPFTEYKWGLPQTSFTKDFKNLIKEDFDIIHIHSPFIMGKLGLKVAKKLNIPCICTVHTRYKFEVKRVAKSNQITKQFMKSIMNVFNKCDKCIVVNDPLIKELKETGYKKEPAVIYNGCDLTPLQNKDKHIKMINKLYDLNEKDTVLLFVGRIINTKNIYFLLEALKLLKEDKIKFKMIYAGGGPEEKKLQSKIKKYDMKDIVITTGQISSRTILSAIYARADLLLLPSIMDTSSLVRIEAAVYETPGLFIKDSMVGTTITDNYNGYISEFDIQKYKDRIKQIITNKNQLKKVSKNAQKTLGKNWQEVAEEYYEEYIKIITKRTDS